MKLSQNQEWARRKNREAVAALEKEIAELGSADKGDAVSISADEHQVGVIRRHDGMFGAFLTNPHCGSMEGGECRCPTGFPYTFRFPDAHSCAAFVVTNMLGERARTFSIRQGSASPALISSLLEVYAELSSKETTLFQVFGSEEFLAPAAMGLAETILDACSVPSHTWEKDPDTGFSREPYYAALDRYADGEVTVAEILHFLMNWRDEQAYETFWATGEGERGHGDAPPVRCPDCASDLAARQERIPGTAANPERVLLSELTYNQLVKSAELLLDELDQSISAIRGGAPASEVALGMMLPQLYAHRYDVEFAQDFQIALAGIADKLEKDIFTLTTTADELALWATILHTLATLDGAPGVSEEIQSFVDAVFKDDGWLVLFRNGITEEQLEVESEANGYVYLKFEEWFLSYAEEEPGGGD